MIQVLHDIFPPPSWTNVPCGSDQCVSFCKYKTSIHKIFTYSLLQTNVQLLIVYYSHDVLHIDALLLRVVPSENDETIINNNENTSTVTEPRSHATT